MIQDIYPSKLHNEYHAYEIRDNDPVFVFNSQGKVMLGGSDGKIVFPTGKDAEDEEYIYLFSVDETRYFLKLQSTEETVEGYEFYGIRDVRDIFDGKEVFAVFTAYHLWKWYSDNVFCGNVRKSLFYRKKRGLYAARSAEI